ncbi:tRNA lysidine(34) synthetase TilS [Desulforhopalus sp. 52FAK]
MIPPLSKKSYSFQKNIQASIKRHQLLHKGDGVIVGVSGGADSTALLLILSSLSLDLQLTAVYIDHGLRPKESPEEIKKVTALCKILEIECITKAVDVSSLATKEGRSTEDAARLLRYQALEEIRSQKKYSKIAVGHHGDDQVEEFFIRLLRGTGATGLSGMRPRYKNIIRPLLFESKENIEQYLIERGVEWSTDSSNLSNHFLRNRVRLDLLPELEKSYNPNLRRAVLHTMDILQEEDNLIQEISEEKYDSCVLEEQQNDLDETTASISLHIQQFLANHLAIQRRIVDKICWKMQSRPSYTTHSDIQSLAKATENSKELHLTNGLRVIKTGSVLLFIRPLLPVDNRGSGKAPEPFTITVTQPGLYKIPGTKYCITLSREELTEQRAINDSTLQVDMDTVSFPMVIRGVRPGERFAPSSGMSKKISRYYNEIQLDKRRRSSWPILVCQHSVVAIIGKIIDHRYRVSAETKRVLNISM